ncbi:carbohydrate ABC transporter permease [Candidatus Riflebacteria bacterium]
MNYLKAKAMPITKTRRSLLPNFITIIFLLPFLLNFLFFWLWPICASFFLAFFSFNPLAPAQTSFIGLGNFITLLEDEAFKKAVVNTLAFVIVTIPITTAMALFLALWINNLKWAQEFFQAAYFIPSLISMVVLATIFKILYATHGPLNQSLHFFGFFVRESCLNNPKTALWAIMAMDIWSAVGYYCLLFIAGLRNIDPQLYEAAEIDGASYWQQFLYITLPLLQPVFLFIVVINSIRSFQIFNEIYVMTQGGPLYATTTMVYDLYETAFQKLEMGKACAKGYFLILVISVFTFIEFQYQKSKA